MRMPKQNFIKIPKKKSSLHHILLFPIFWLTINIGKILFIFVIFPPPTKINMKKICKKQCSSMCISEHKIIFQTAAKLEPKNKKKNVFMSIFFFDKNFSFSLRFNIEIVYKQKSRLYFTVPNKKTSIINLKKIFFLLKQ